MTTAEALQALKTAGSHPIVRAFPQGAIIAFDADLRYLCAGGRGLAEVGLSPEMLEGRTVHEVFPPEVAQHIAPRYRRALGGESSETDVSYGGRIFTQILGPLVDECGNVVAGLGITRDVTAARSFEAEMAQESRRLRDAESIGQVGLWDLNLRTQAVSWSKGVFDLYGLDQHEFAGNYDWAVNLIHPDDRAGADAGIAACISDGVPFRVTYRIHRAGDGELRWIDSRGEAVYENGERVWIVGAIADVTERVTAQAQAQADQALQQAVIEASPDVIFVSDVSTRSTVWSNRPLSTMLGHVDEPGGAALSIDHFIPDDERAQFDSAFAAAVGGTPGEVISINHRLTAADGSDRWFSRRITALRRDDAGQVTELVNVLRDISDAVAAEERLRHSALHDNLTGLPNRALLMDRLGSALTRMEHSKREISVLFCDLDGFKRINDTAGHSAGDQALMETARRLQAAVREGDTVARIGGDEFVLIIEPWNRNGDHEPATAEHDRAAGISVADRIRESMRRPVIANGIEHQLSVSIGVAFATHLPAGHHHGTTAEQLLLDADSAMYRAKGRGKDRFEVFQEVMRTDGAQRSKIEQILRQVLRPVAMDPSVGTGNGTGLPRLSVAYQPIFSSSPRALIGFEALARLVDAQGFAIAPDVFIPIAEETGIVGGIDILVLDLACGQLAAWRADVPGMADVVMSVNVSALHAQHAALSDDIHRALRRHGLAPKDLMLELTESSLLSAANSTIAALRRLHDEGVGIAIDDFGTGYASLRYLATLPISSLKIDRSFTAGLPLDRTCQKIVNAVAGLAADLQLSCVVEGVETVDQHDSLPGGVNVQGFLTGRPQHPDEVDLHRWLAHQN